MSFTSRAPSFTLHMIANAAGGANPNAGLSPGNLGSPDGVANTIRTGQNSVRNSLQKKPAAEQQ